MQIGSKSPSLWTLEKNACRIIQASCESPCCIRIWIIIFFPKKTEVSRNCLVACNHAVPTTTPRHLISPVRWQKRCSYEIGIILTYPVVFVNAILPALAAGVRTRSPDFPACYFSACSVSARNCCTHSAKSSPARSARTASHHTHSPILDGSLSSASDGQRPSWLIVSRPTSPASVRKARASSSDDHSEPWYSRSSAW